ncbi:Wall-associated receptor kinase 1 [Dichanthelium oligosanthes]|uniref:Wall-associated receptor kinase 1 n=1 Tax=Dichanthelium oligosanthes TaxID=888268 RepID=A0A1E5V9F6_9POAL|nr:Wall-associated receptor kinase 1 [Dichanthelium oligosanthes]
MELMENRLIAGHLVHGNDKVKWTLGDNNHIKNFTEDDIERITRNYRFPVGKGGFGEVYRGFLDDEHDLVAVKRYIRGDLREEFLEEASIHSNHKNVVRLIGYCIGESDLTMVNEYISKGNLDDTLHRNNVSIPLDIRLGIAIACAEALSYIHSMHLSSDSLVCHGDIKPANILLDYNLTAKVLDFGLSRLLSGGITRYTSNVKGSIDYMDPIYLQEGRLTPRSDVYSFGAVLLELIARRRVKEGNVSLIGTFCKACAEGKGLRELFDAEIANESNVKILGETARLAAECLRLDIDKRPRMDYVVKHLRMFWKDLQGGQDIGWHKKSFGIFKRHVGDK